MKITTEYIRPATGSRLQLIVETDDPTYEPEYVHGFILYATVIE